MAIGEKKCGYDWQLVRMLTLGITNVGLTPDEHRAYFQEAWRRLTIFIRRSKRFSNTQKKFNYIRVNEMHQSGYYHVHILVDSYLDFRLLYDEWNRILLKVLPFRVLVGRDFKQLGSVNIKLLGGGGSNNKTIAKNYVTKAQYSNYITKLNRHLSRFRVWSRSLNLPKFIQKQNNDGRYVPCNKKNMLYLYFCFLQKVLRDLD